MIEENVQYVLFCVTSHNTGIFQRQVPQSLENTRYSSNSLESTLNSFSRVIRILLNKRSFQNENFHTITIKVKWKFHSIIHIDRSLSSWLNKFMLSLFTCDHNGRENFKMCHTTRIVKKKKFLRAKLICFLNCIYKHCYFQSEKYSTRNIQFTKIIWDSTESSNSSPLS